MNDTLIITCMGDYQHLVTEDRPTLFIAVSAPRPHTKDCAIVKAGHKHLAAY